MIHTPYILHTFYNQFVVSTKMKKEPPLLKYGECPLEIPGFPVGLSIDIYPMSGIIFTSTDF